MAPRLPLEISAALADRAAALRTRSVGRVLDLDEVSRREKVWWGFISELERETGEPVAEMSAEAFRLALEERLDLESFEARG